MGRSRVKDGKVRCNKCKTVYDVSIKPNTIQKEDRKRLVNLLVPDVIQFIRDLYAMPRDSSYFIKLPKLPYSIQELM
jgi:hypothetical protein